MFELNESTGKYTVRGQVSAKAIIDQATRILAKSGEAIPVCRSTPPPTSSTSEHTALLTAIF